MAYYGDIHLGDTLDLNFTTTSGSTGAPTTLSGTPVISAYVGSSTTQITAGITLTVDFDSVTGMNHVTVVASSGNGYTAATNVDLVITTGTVGGTSAVGYVVGSFSIDNRGVNVARINAVSTSSVTTVSANVGTTQPLNFTGTAGSALVKGDMVDIAGAAVSTSSAQLGVNAVNIGGTAQTGRDIGASVLLSAGTGTGQLDFTSGVVKANLAQILGTALTETAGQIAAAFKKFFNIATPASTMDHLTLLDTVTTATTATNLTNAPTNGDLTATMKTSIGTAVAASAVASVTGNVGGNVTGSVGSVATGGITRASLAADTGLQSIRSNTAQAGTGTTITLDASASATNSFYDNCLLLLTGGTGAGQARFITAYVGATKVATVATWVTTPDNTSTFAILPFDAVAGASAPTVAQIATGVWTDLLASSDFSTASSIGALLKTDIDAAISSRMATYTQPTGFLAATFPTTVASPTNITAGTITTVTNLTNAPTAGDFTATMKTSIGTAVAASAVASVTGNIGGNLNGNVVGTVPDSSGVTTLLSDLTGANAEPTSVPASNASLLSKIAWLFLLSRNKRQTTATTDLVRNNADSGTVGTSTISDDGTTFTRGTYT